MRPPEDVDFGVVLAADGLGGLEPVAPAQVEMFIETSMFPALIQ